jgi:hypothetical protein
MLGSATEAEDIVQEAFLRFRVRDREHRRLELLVDVVHESPDAGGSPSKRTSMPPCDTSCGVTSRGAASSRVAGDIHEEEVS